MYLTSLISVLVEIKKTRHRFSTVFANLRQRWLTIHAEQHHVYFFLPGVVVRPTLRS